MNKLAIRFGLLLSVSWLLSACGNSAESGDTQTNWFLTCNSDADCAGLECVCGRCVKSCSTTDDCSGTPLVTSCQAADSQAAQALCTGVEPSAMCLGACDDPTACSSGEQCFGGACLPAGSMMGGGDASEFCQRYIDEYAEYMESCGCSTAAAELYRQEFLPNCEPGGYFDGVVQAVAAGNLIYDPVAADALFARYDDPDPLCVQEPFRALRLDSLEVYSWAGVFTGTRELGEPCTMPVTYKGGTSDCREGVCAGTVAGSGVCVALVGVGEECDASGDDNLDGASARLCFDIRQPDPDGEYESAFDSLRCVATGSGATTQICARDLALGEECHSSEVCASGFCLTSGVPLPVCAAKLADGEECVGGSQCLSGGCTYGTTPQVCGPPLADGQPCSYDDEVCASGACLDTMVCGPAPTQAVGESCSAASECISLGHGGSVDLVCHEGICVADICASYLN